MEQQVLIRRDGVKVRKSKNTIPIDILEDVELQKAIEILPKNYNFEIYKSVWKIRLEKPELTALQFPEGLLMYSCIIADILSKFGQSRIVIMGDVTYGACCIDDFSAEKLGAGLIIHYGHSCLVPMSITKVKVLYVFVEILFDPSHFVESVRKHFGSEHYDVVYLAGTVQFIGMIHAAGATLLQSMPHIKIPQVKPLSAGASSLCLFCLSPPIHTDNDPLKERRLAALPATCPVKMEEGHWCSWPTAASISRRP